MRRLGQPVVLAGIAAALAIAVVALLLVRNGADGSSDALRAQEVGRIAAEATLTPRVALFGDTVRARVDVVLDKSLVDPDSVRVAADFAPFEIVRREDPDRRELRDAVVLRTTFVLRCATGTCVPSGEFTTYEFPPARISFAEAGDEAGKDTIRATLPSVRMYSRFAAFNSSSVRRSTPWHADVISLPAVSYRFDPDLLAALLLAGATLVGLAGGVLAYRAWPRRTFTPAPEPEPPPLPVVSPLEQALALLETSIAGNGAEGRRRALELVAEELEHADWGDHELAGVARTLAWSEGIPDLEQTTRLAARVRSTLPGEVEGDENAASNGAGRVA